MQALQRVLDIFWIVAAHLVASWAYSQPWRRDSTVVAIIVFSAAAELCGLYRPWRSERLGVEARMVLVAWSITAGAVLMVAFATKTSGEYSRVVSFGWFGLTTLLLCSWRVMVRLFLRVVRASGRNSRAVAILGATPSGAELCAQIAQRPWMGLNLVGVYDSRGSERRHTFPSNVCPYAGGEAELLAACRANRVDVVYIALPLRAESRIAALVRALSDTTVTVYLLADFFTYDLLSARWSAIGEFPLISIHDTPFRGINGSLKRLEDLVLGALIMGIISVPLLLISLLVKLTSPGPIFFRQRRYGLNGREIQVLKFRTMTVCEDGAQIKQATANDSRVTKLGRFLRRTSLDELPQFLQVLTGEMSIVGPRPHAVAHNEIYRNLIQGYMLRHKVKPGITGWAQVNGWRGETPEVSWMEKRVQHDLEYIERWTLLWDLKIILLTVAGRKTRRNAY